jgi:hypothetical protein
LSFSRRSVSRSPSAVVRRKVRLGTPVCSTQAQGKLPRSEIVAFILYAHLNFFWGGNFECRRA